MNILLLRRTRDAGGTPPRGPLSVVSTADGFGCKGSPKAFSQADTQAVAYMVLQIQKKQQLSTIAQQSFFVFPSVSALSPLALLSAPSLHRRATQQFPSSVVLSAVGSLISSVQPAQTSMSFLATITQSPMQPTIPPVPTYTPIPSGVYLQQYNDYGSLVLTLL